MKFLLQLMFIFFGCTLFNAQTGFSVSGIVLYSHDKTPLSNAKVQFGNVELLSDQNGKFLIQNKQAGNYTLSVTHPDCDTFVESIQLNETIFLTVYLEHHEGNIESVTLHGAHQKKSSVIISTISDEDLQRKSTENLGNLLTGISGVTTLKTGNNIAKPVIHGLYGSRISILNNGVKMAEQEWGVEHAPNVDPGAFEHIDVVKGASALKYGNDAVGGVVILEPQILPKKDTLMGNVSFSGISNGRGSEWSAKLAQSWKNQWFVTSGGRYKKLGDQYVPHHTLQNTGAEVGSFNFAFGKRSFSEGLEISYSGIQQSFGIFKGAHLGSPEDFYQAINFGQPFYMDDFSFDIHNPKQEVNHYIAKVSTYKRFQNFGKLSFQYAFQLNRRKEFDIRRGEELSKLPSMDLRLITHSASLNHVIERPNWQLESGISTSFQDNYPNPETKARRLIPDYYRYDAGAYSVFHYRFNSHFHLEAGLRYDFSRYDAYKYYDASEWGLKYAGIFPNFFVSENDSRILTRPILDFHNTSGNIGLDYSKSKAFAVKLNLSKADRTPNPAELFADGLHHSAAIIEAGNLEIKKETLYHATLSLTTELSFLEGFSLQVNPYAMFSHNFINQVPTGVRSTNRGVFPVWEFQQIKARILGIDVDAQLHFTDYLKWKGSFSVLKGDDFTHNEPLILMMPTNFRNGIEFNSKKDNGFYILIENETSLHQNRFPLRNLNVDFIENGTLVSQELDYSTPPSGYSIFNVALGVDVLKNLNFNFRLNNVFNTEYREYLNRLRYFMPEPGRNFVATLQFKF